MSIHKSVLLREAITGLNLKKGAVVVDATLGGGGHASEILRRIGKTGKLIALDVDKEAIKKFSSKFKVQSSKLGAWKSETGNLFLVKDNFADLETILGGLGVKTVDAVLADLGYSSDQLEDEKLGMSFQKDAPLDMRFDQNSGITAKDAVNNYGQRDLERIIKKYGEERFAQNIAKKIIEYRKDRKIGTTLELAKIIESAVPERYKHGRIHPATKTFQALRIETNKELENLEKFIPQAIGVLATGGRLGIISFHSLEDRIVKNIIRENARGCICPPDFPECRCGHKAEVKIITKKPITPSALEIKENSRARSAKLRICEKLT
jgi:16S rRNA (cytosine1402-N4)-methyltransferase